MLRRWCGGEGGSYEIISILFCGEGELRDNSLKKEEIKNKVLESV